MIDKDKVKAFWDERASRALDFNSFGNLEQDPENLALKVRLESEKVLGYLGSLAGKTVLDLGAGVGQWAFRFLDHGAAHVTAVEYSAEMADLGIREAQRRGTSSVEFVISPVETFASEKRFDIVFMSGLLLYLNDDAAEKLVANLSRFCRPDTFVLLRDGTALGQRYEIDNRVSQHLQSHYSAIYRTAEEFEALFGRHGFALIRHENMFYDGCPLNKFPETRLRIYELRLDAESARDA